MSNFPGTTTPDYITAVRVANQKVWDGINQLKAFQREWQALDYGTGTNLAIPTAPHVNSNMTKEALGAVLFDTANALSAVLDAGHATNMAKLL